MNHFLKDEKNTRQDTEEHAETPGSTLKKARVARKLTLENIANDLNLSQSFIASIEDDQYEAIHQPPVFVFGYVRNYAKLMAFPTQQIDQMIQTIRRTYFPEPRAAQSIATYQPPTKMKRFSPKKWLFYALCATILFLFVWLTTSQRKPVVTQSNLPANQTTIVQPTQTAPTMPSIVPTQTHAEVHE